MKIPYLTNVGFKLSRIITLDINLGHLITLQMPIHKMKYETATGCLLPLALDRYESGLTFLFYKKGVVYASNSRSCTSDYTWK